MRHDREFWRGHVQAWRASGLTQREYCRSEGLHKGSLSYWSSTFGREGAGASGLVEVGVACLNDAVARAEPVRPVEVVVEGRYLLRLWPGTDGAHMRQVLSVLEDRS